MDFSIVKSKMAALAVVAVGAGQVLLACMPSVPGGSQEPIRSPKCLDLGYANGFEIKEPSVSGHTYRVGDPGTHIHGDASGFEVRFNFTHLQQHNLWATGFHDASIPFNAVYIANDRGDIRVGAWDSPRDSTFGFKLPGSSIAYAGVCWEPLPPPDEP